MSSQSGAGDVSFLTTLTHVRSLVVVESLVQPQVDGLGELLGAFITGVRLFSQVKSHVSLEIGIGAEAFATITAGEGPHSSVNQLVFLEVGELGEGFVAAFKLAGVRSEAGVGSQVSFQVGNLTKGFVTIPTLVLSGALLPFPHLLRSLNVCRMIIPPLSYV